MVYSIAWNYLHDTALAEEIAQEAFLELHRSLPRIESEAHAVHFLRRVAVHRAIDEGRRRRWQSRAGLEDAPEPVAPATVGDPLLDGALRRLVDSLPSRSRMIVVLRYQEDLEPGEIAETLGIPVGTVKSNLHRSLAVLRKRLQSRDGKPAVGVSK
jgi:RNA polymerase sigma-70 factor (ECF subfamily)